VYGFNAGYWGPHIGFYGGVNYGFGYVGVGYAGGRWNGGAFAYNTAVNNVNVSVVHNTYNETVVNNVTVNHTSYNGGTGGIAAAPTAQERAAAQERHVPPTPAQQQHVQAAAKNPALFARANGGHPAIAATARPGAFTGPGVVGARGAAPAKPAVNNDVMHANGQRPNAPPAAPAAKPASPAPAAKPAQASTTKPGAPKAAPPKPAPPKPAPKPAPKPPKEDKPQR
jgi:hypothetical protein